jgi:hypothetical protein
MPINEQQYVALSYIKKTLKLKGIFQPFELGGVTRLIRSAVKFWKAGNLKKKVLMIQTHERSLKQISAA